MIMWTDCGEPAFLLKHDSILRKIAWKHSVIFAFGHFSKIS